MLIKTHSATHFGVYGIPIHIEAIKHSNNPQIHITGLASESVRESRDRIRACLAHLGHEIPSAKIVLHLSPAYLKKEGTQYDVAMTLATLAAEGLLDPTKLLSQAFLGELSLEGSLLSVPQILGLLQTLVNEKGIDEIVIPKANEKEAALLSNPKIKVASHLGEILEAIKNNEPLPAPKFERSLIPSPKPKITLDNVIGQNLAKRSIQIALAGRHHYLMLGSPGVGKSLLASATHSLLPPPSPDESVDIMKHNSFRNEADDELLRPFRQPHHSISKSGLLGGGSAKVQPGEISFAHHGILFLDEFAEFNRDCIEGLREPLQEGQIHIHRVGHRLSLPSRFTLLAAMNPCPCGNRLNPQKTCRCSMEQRRNYIRRLSGPIVDRIDLFSILSIPKDNIETNHEFTHEKIKDSISSAISRQQTRYKYSWMRNGDGACSLSQRCFTIPREEHFKDRALSVGLSYRGQHKIIRIARTIADLNEHSSIEEGDLAEAWLLRCPDLHELSSAF